LLIVAEQLGEFLFRAREAADLAQASMSIRSRFSRVSGFFCSYDARPDLDFFLAAKAASPAGFMRPAVLSAATRRMLMLLQCEPGLRGVKRIR